MAPDQNDGSNPRIAVTITPAEKSALEHWAHELSTPNNRVYVAGIAADLLREGLIRHEDELPAEARDLLDTDSLANAGGGDIELRLEVIDPENPEEREVKA